MTVVRSWDVKPREANSALSTGHIAIISTHLIPTIDAAASNRKHFPGFQITCRRQTWAGGVAPVALGA
jgi:hypothetical protein